jgi:FKBP-type peptidyl-prolyl cis-trans isomerase
MGVVKTTVSDGDKINFPKKGDLVTMHYDGTLVKDGEVCEAASDFVACGIC